MPLINALAAIIDETPAQLRLTSDAKPADVALAGVEVVEIEFPKFRDGRGFTLARNLRECHGYTGDIRAVGHFIPDQFRFLIECGFSSFETPEAHPPAQFAAALAPRQPGQALRRHLTRALES
jgi:uncharacterized protein (DUF934 family)